MLPSGALARTCVGCEDGAHEYGCGERHGAHGFMRFMRAYSWRTCVEFAESALVVALAVGTAVRNRGCACAQASERRRALRRCFGSVTDLSPRARKLPRVSGLILVVDDEQELVAALEFNLRREGFRTLMASTGKGALELASQDPRPDLVLLDLMLPDISGTEVCHRLRMSERTRDIPVVMVTAKGEEIDRVVGLELGADDYIVKPFSVRELLLRVKAILRRRETHELDIVDVRFGTLRIDMAGHRIWVEDEEIALTALEFRLLTTFLSRKGRVQTRDTLLHDVWGVQSGVTTRTVDTHVQRLRKKLGSAGEYVETLRGVGYRFRSHPNEIQS